MNSIPALTLENVASLDGILGDFRKKADADLTVVIDRGGNVISQFGDISVMDVTIIAALAAGPSLPPKNWRAESARWSSMLSIIRAMEVTFS